MIFEHVTITIYLLDLDSHSSVKFCISNLYLLKGKIIHFIVSIIQYISNVNMA